jgi:predicted helicase
MKSISGIDWKKLQPDEKFNWLTEGLLTEFETFLPMGKKESKGSKEIYAEVIFKLYSLGVATNRDVHVYSFNPMQVRNQVNIFIDIYNNVVDRLKRLRGEVDLESLIDTTDARIKWTRQVKTSLRKLEYSEYVEIHVRKCLYRPFTRKYLYFDDFWNEERYKLPLLFPTPASEQENIAIWLKVGSEWPMFALAINVIPDLLPQGGSQCFPYYSYNEDGTNRHENITDWALSQFQAKYGPEVTKWDIFHYVYAMLHHPQYRERYAENLKRDLPHIPLLHRKEAFLACIAIGRQLMDIHLHYEQAKEYPLTWIENQDVPFSWRVEKMRLTPDRSAVIVNESLTLAAIPQECFQYRLGNRSALEWVIDQYQVSVDKRSGIVSDPNSLDDAEYIVRLVGRVVTVSVETVGLVKELVQVVKMEDWMDSI